MANYNAVDMDWLGGELGECTDILRKKINSSADIAFPEEFKSLLDGITPVSEGWVNIDDLIIHATESATGTYIGTGANLADIQIAIGFEPKIFFMNNTGSVYSNSTNVPYSLVSSLSIYKDSVTPKLRKSSFVLKGDSTNGYGRGGSATDSNYFKPTANGVQGVGSSVRANNGVKFDWYAYK